MDDNEIKILLKDSLLKIPSEDFTSQTMQKIHKMEKEFQIKRNIKRSYLFICITIFLIPIEFIFLSKLISAYRPYMMQYVQSFGDSTLIELPIAIAVTFILLYQLDSLFRLIIDNKKI
jgi:hypothetical protein